VLGGDRRVTIEVDLGAPKGEGRAARIIGPPASLSDEALASRYTFGAFVVGNSNQFAQAACQAVTEFPSRVYNPLFIYGGVGLGKTHLLHAIGHETARLYPALRLLYLSCEHFTNELIDAIRHDRTAQFRAKYRTIDLLLIDDIQFLSGKERTQEEFFHTFNDLYEARKQIVVSSDSAPKEIPDIEARLRSRFEWGLIAGIQPPDFETRVAILKKKAEIGRVGLPDDVAYLIANRIKANIREMEGSLTRMIAFCAFSRREMTVDLAQEVLSGLWGEEEQIITIEHIQRTASEFLGVRLSDMGTNNRTRAVAVPRQIAMYLARQLTHASLAEVGRAFGGKDHTTVLHAVEKIQALIQGDPKFKKSIDTLIQGVTR
jgi:chromosomal replication initiator protein